MTSTGPRQPFTFADLFAGIGGFHAAGHAAGGRGWFASEIDQPATKVYLHNWGLEPLGDIVKLTDPDVKVPNVDVLFGGFPCQPFSKSGFQRGVEDTRGTLFFNICRILGTASPPAVIVLENVRNLAGPRQRETWVTIVETLRDLGYAVPSEPAVLSPHHLPRSLGGRPQVRERVFITGTFVGVGHAREPRHLKVQPIAANRPVDGWDPHSWDLETDLLQDDADVKDLARYRLSPAEVGMIDTWNEFLASVDVERLPGFPIWADEFRSPAVIPPGTPAWKANFLRKNAKLYRDHAAQIDEWRGGDSPDDAPRLAHLTPSRRKLEWQAGHDIDRDLWRTIMHFRPSGIRAKLPTYLPALVAITQTSVYGPRRRRITPVEAARAQGLPAWFDFKWDLPDGTVFDQPDAASYKQLGNGVNVGAAYYALRATVERDRALVEKVAPHVVAAVLAAPENPDDALKVKPARNDSESAGETVRLESGRGRAVRESVRDVDLLTR